MTTVQAPALPQHPAAHPVPYTVAARNLDIPTYQARIENLDAALLGLLGELADARRDNSRLNALVGRLRDQVNRIGFRLWTTTKAAEDVTYALANTVRENDALRAENDQLRQELAAANTTGRRRRTRSR